jgi:hypothetical protein
MTDIPSSTVFTSAPLRNRLRVELHAPPSDVWALVADCAENLVRRFGGRIAQRYVQK